MDAGAARGKFGVRALNGYPHTQAVAAALIEIKGDVFSTDDRWNAEFGSRWTN